jgi:tryptophan synthase alpha chain
MSYKTTFARLKKEKRIGLCPFAVLGDPTPSECLSRIKEYLKTSPDFLEFGIPFSDPIADGPVIQAADERAIKAGTSPKVAIGLIKKIRFLCNPRENKKYANKNEYLSLVNRSRIPALRDGMTPEKTTDTPIGILVYSNLVIHYGIQKFYKDLKAAGADSILIADVPLEEIKPFAAAAKKYGLHQIFLVSEYTDGERLKKIEKHASGFLYAVSALGITGVRQKLKNTAGSLVRRLKKQTKLPVMVGFGISKPEHVKNLQKAGAAGAIVGSLLVKTPKNRLPKTLNSLRI